MASISIELFKSKQLKNGKHPVMIRITHNRTNRYFNTKLSAFPDEWDSDTKQFNINYKRNNNLNKFAFDNINLYLKTKFNDTQEVILELEKRNKNYSIDELYEKIKKPLKATSFYMFTQNHIDDLKASGKFGNAENYKTTLNILKNFTNDKDFSFEQINYKWLNNFEKYHLSKDKGKDKKNSLNGLSVYLRTIRALYNKAIKEDIVSNESYPFGRNGYIIKSSPIIKRAISKEKIELIKNLYLPENSYMWHVKNIFLFSFYCRGMNWIDMAFLKMTNITDGRITYIREKTKRKGEGKVFSIKIVPQMQEILDLYTENKKRDDFVFPIITKKSEEEQRKEIRNKRGTFNKNLRKIATLCKIEENLTSYVSRHSWATIALRKVKDIAIVSDGLGHRDITTTQTYIKSFGDEELDNANELIINE